MNQVATPLSVPLRESFVIYGASTNAARRRPMPAMLGFTIVEMLAVVATGSVLLVIAMGVVHRVMRVDSQWKSQANVSRSLTRLARDFRTDVHTSRDAVLTQDPPTLKLTSTDSTVITYEVAADEIIRDLQSPGADRRREFYAKPASYEVEFTIQEKPHWIDLRILRDPQLKGVKPRVALHVDAEIGRFQRLSQAGESQ